MHVTTNNIWNTQHHTFSMKQIKCPYESCNKEFEKPVIVTNFSFIPKKETYYACPYCLTKIGDTIKECDCTPVNAEETVCTENEKPEEKSIQPENSTMPRRVLYRSNVPQAVTTEKLETLEKERADLLAELDELRKGATQKISILEEEVAALREEAEILKQLTER